MKCFRLLTAIAVLGFASVTWADDHLPPAPKKTAVVSQNNSPAATEVKVTAVIKNAEKAPLPPVCGKALETPMPNASEKVRETLPPTPSAEDQATCTSRQCCRCQCRCRCACYQPVQPVRFLVNEFLCKPIYGVQKAFNDAEGRCLCRQECCLECRANQLAEEANCLSHRVERSNLRCLGAKFQLLKEEADYAARANRLAVERARLECRKADYCRQKRQLEKREAELYPCD